MKNRLPLGIMLVGAALRLASYLSNPPLWGDEGMALYNILRPPLEAMRGARLAQSIPPGFLLVQGAVVRLFGTDELVLHAVPLLASLAVLPLFWILAKRVLPTSFALLALAIFALSPYLITYAAVMKQYETDALIAVTLTLLALRATEPMERREAIWIGMAGLTLAFFTQTAILLLPGLGLAVYLTRWRKLGALPWTLALWALGTGLAGLISSRSMAADGLRVNVDYWLIRGAYLPPLTSFDALSTWGRGFLAVFQHPVGLLIPATGLVLLLGLRRDVLIALSPLLPLVVFSVLELYPFGPLMGGYTSGRVLIFLLPALCLGIASGVAFLARHSRPLAGVFAIALLAQLGFASVQREGVRYDLEPTLARLDRERQPGDRLLVEYWLLMPYRYETGVPLLDPLPPTLPHLGTGRTWLLYALQRGDSTAVDLGKRGRVLSATQSDGYALTLVDLSPKHAHKPPPDWQTAAMTEVP